MEGRFFEIDIPRRKKSELNENQFWKKRLEEIHENLTEEEKRFDHKVKEALIKYHEEKQKMENTEKNMECSMKEKVNVIKEIKKDNTKEGHNSNDLEKFIDNDSQQEKDLKFKEIKQEEGSIELLKKNREEINRTKQEHEKLIKKKENGLESLQKEMEEIKQIEQKKQALKAEKQVDAILAEINEKFDKSELIKQYDWENWDKEAESHLNDTFKKEDISGEQFEQIDITIQDDKIYKEIELLEQLKPLTEPKSLEEPKLIKKETLTKREFLLKQQGNIHLEEVFEPKELFEKHNQGKQYKSLEISDPYSRSSISECPRSEKSLENLESNKKENISDNFKPEIFQKFLEHEEISNILVYGYGKWVPIEWFKEGHMSELLQQTRWYEEYYLKNPELGSYLSQLNKELKVTCREFGNLIGMKHRHFSEIINNKRDIKLKEFLNLPERYLINRLENLLQNNIDKIDNILKKRLEQKILALKAEAEIGCKKQINTNNWVESFRSLLNLSDKADIVRAYNILRNKVENMLTDKKTSIFNKANRHFKLNLHINALEKFMINGQIYVVIPDSQFDTKKVREETRQEFAGFIKKNNGKFPERKEILPKIELGLLNHEKKVYSRNYKTFCKGPGALPTESQTFKVKKAEIFNSLSPFEKWNEFIRDHPNEWNELYLRYIKIANDLRHLPGEIELEERKEWWIRNRIVKNGGYSEFKKIILQQIQNNAIYKNLNAIKELREARKLTKNEKIEKFINEHAAEWEELLKKYLTITKDLGHLPSYLELRKRNEEKLINKIDRIGGFIEFKKRIIPEIKNDSIKIPKDLKDWSTFVIEIFKEMEEIKKNTKKLEGKFPTYSQLRERGRNDLVRAILDYYGGWHNVKVRMKYEVRRQSGYWKKWENVESELGKLIHTVFNGEFPTSQQLTDIGCINILGGIKKHHGGLRAARIKMGYDLDNWNEKARYYFERGYKTEIAIKDILRKWAKMNGFPYSKQKQIKLGKNRRIEFTCGKNIVYGVDITNSKTVGTVEAKWKYKEYNKYVDYLWVIVVSNKFNQKQFKKWNQESPKNVLIIDYRFLEKFLNQIDKKTVPFEIPLEKKRYLDALAMCTIENKEKVKRWYRSGKQVIQPQKDLFSL